MMQTLVVQSVLFESDNQRNIYAQVKKLFQVIRKVISFILAKFDVSCFMSMWHHSLVIELLTLKNEDNNKCLLLKMKKENKIKRQ